MKRRVIGALAALAVVVLSGPQPAHAADGKLLESVAPGPYEDPFLAAGNAIVRGQGFRGEFSTLVGLSGLADQPAMCRHDCACRETMHSAASLRALVQPLKGSVTRHGQGVSEPDAAWSALRGEIGAGRAVLAEGVSGPGRLDLVIGYEDRARSLLVRGRGGVNRYSFDRWVKGRWTFAVARLGTTELPGRKAEMDAIAGIVTRSQQPRIEGGCVARTERTQNAVGLEAYDLWAERAKSDAAADPAAKAQRLESWTEKSEMLSKFMRTAASHQDGKTAESLNSAAAAVEKEVDSGLEPLSKTCPFPTKPQDASMQSDPALREKQAALMQTAGDLRRQALERLEPAAFDHLGLTPEQREAASIKGGAKAAKPEALRAMLKSPDATMRTLGALATRRSGDVAMADALVENLNSPDPVEARTNLAALQSVNPADLVGTLKKQSANQNAAVKFADDGSMGNDGVGTQVQYLVQDMERAAEKEKRHPLAFLLSGPFLFGVLGVAVLGLGLVAWKVAGPQRLASSVEEAPVPVPTGIPAEAARLEQILGRPPVSGLLLTHLDSRGQGYKQGLRVGDIITRYGGQPVANLEELRRLTGQTGAGQRELAARRELKIVKTVVAAGPLGVDGVAILRGTPCWRRKPSLPFAPDYSGLAGETELWYQFTRNGRPIGFERRRTRWIKNELELACIAGFQNESGEQSVQVTQRLAAGETLQCTGIRMTTRGGNAMDLNASYAGGRWVILLGGNSVTRKIPEGALPAASLAVLAATLPFESQRAYDVVQINESVFEPSYGCQIESLGVERIELNGVGTEAWGFALLEYGMRQMTFWFDPSRRLLRTEYAGLVATLTTAEAALEGLPESLTGLTQEA